MLFFAITTYPRKVYKIINKIKLSSSIIVRKGLNIGLVLPLKGTKNKILRWIHNNLKVNELMVKVCFKKHAKNAFHRQMLFKSKHLA